MAHKENKARVGKGTKFQLSEDGTLYFRNRLCVPNDAQLKKEILMEAHQTAYSIHLDSTKMYHDLKSIYWWPNMKKDITAFVKQCLICQQVKAKHQHPAYKL